MTNEPNKNRAFTLIELLVVIAIIGILSSVVLAALSGARERAQITRTVSDLEQIETAMTMWMQGEGHTQWPEDVDVGTGGVNEPISEMMDADNLNKYLTSAPEPPFGTGEYIYDNNNDSRGDCGSTAGGVNLSVKIGQGSNDIEIMESISEIIDNDDGDLSCGKVVRYTGDLRYNLSLDQSF